jgi:hypothetical protein
VLCVTGRNESAFTRRELFSVFGAQTYSLLHDVIFCNHSPKRDRTLALGYKIDIWIDDMPEGIGATDKIVFEKLEDMFPVCETLPVFTKGNVDPNKVWMP